MAKTEAVPTPAVPVPLDVAARWASSCADYAAVQIRATVTMPLAVAARTMGEGVDVAAVRRALTAEVDDARREATWCSRALALSSGLTTEGRKAIVAGVARSVAASTRALLALRAAQAPEAAEGMACRWAGDVRAALRAVVRS